MIRLYSGFYLFPLSRAVNSNNLIFDPSEVKIDLYKHTINEYWSRVICARRLLWTHTFTYLEFLEVSFPWHAGQLQFKHTLFIYMIVHRKIYANASRRIDWNNFENWLSQSFCMDKAVMQLCFQPVWKWHLLHRQPVTLFRWWADDGPLLVLFVSSLSLSSPNQQKMSELEPLWQNSGSAHENSVLLNF